LRVPCLALLAFTMSIALPVEPVDAADSIENHYEMPGPWGVSTRDVTDSAGNVIYQLFYPTNLGAGGVRHPIITWGNGTGASPTAYAGGLNHFASWGFVVVASTSPSTGHGTEMIAGAHYLAAENGRSGSLFFGKLDTGNIAAVGHSQGAGGAINAANRSNGLITAVLPISTPTVFGFWLVVGEGFSPAQLTAPVFFVTGANDVLAPPSASVSFYQQVPGPAAVGVRTTVGHILNLELMLGYETAWLRYQLFDDATARSAFVGSPPEINTHTAWRSQAQKNLS
jgi:pimeloyl-ACP methyl ester carboxylesterase